MVAKVSGDHHRVLVPGRVARGGAVASPQVDHFLAAPVRRDRGADLSPLDEIALELGAHGVEPGRHKSVDGDRLHGRPPATAAARTLGPRSRSSLRDSIMSQSM